MRVPDPRSMTTCPKTCYLAVCRDRARLGGLIGRLRRRATEQRGGGGKQGHSGGGGEDDGQAVVEGAGDEVREEGLAGDRGSALRGQRVEYPGRAEEGLHRVG